MPKTITITKEDFDNAITRAMTKSMDNPYLKDSAEATLLYILGGIAFAKCVKDELFHDEHDIWKCEEN